MSKRPRRRTIERAARGLGVEVKTLLEGVETEAPKAEAPPSQRSLFNGFEEDQRRQEEGSSIADDKRWLAMQLRRGNLTRLQIAGVSVDPEDLPDEVVAFLARDLRQLFQTTDITLGDRIESIIRIHLESGEELVMSAWCEVA
jgi:hypothetical protein